MQENLCHMGIRTSQFLMGDTTEGSSEQQAKGPVGFRVPERWAPACQPTKYSSGWQRAEAHNYDRCGGYSKQQHQEEEQENREGPETEGTADAYVYGKFQVVSVVIGALGAVTLTLEEWLQVDFSHNLRSPSPAWCWPWRQPLAWYGTPSWVRGSVKACYTNG